MKRLVLAALAFAIGAAGIEAIAAERGEVVVLTSGDPAAWSQLVAAFQQELGLQANVESVGQGAAAEGVGARVRASHPALVVAMGTAAVRAAREQLPELPTVSCMVRRATAQGAAVLATPDAAAQVAALRPFFLKLQSIGILYAPETTEDDVESLASGLREAGVVVALAPVASSQAISTALRALLAKNVDMVLLTSDRTLLDRSALDYVVSVSIERGFPVVAYEASLVKQGVAIALLASPDEVGKQAALLAKEVLGGANPAELGVRRPASANVAVNVRVIRNLGLVEPKGLVEKAVLVVGP